MIEKFRFGAASLNLNQKTPAQKYSRTIPEEDSEPSPRWLGRFANNIIWRRRDSGRRMENGREERNFAT
jgi:hypothetical protein